MNQESNMNQESSFNFEFLMNIGMFLSLLSLSYWTGTQAEQLKAISVQVRINSAAIQVALADSVALKEKNAAQDQNILLVKELILQRLDRIERKLDQNRN